MGNKDEFPAGRLAAAEPCLLLRPECCRGRSAAGAGMLQDPEVLPNSEKGAHLVKHFSEGGPICLGFVPKKVKYNRKATVSHHSQWLSFSIFYKVFVAS